MKRIEDRLAEIARRKHRLVARAGSQRLAIAGEVRNLHGPIAVADKGLEVARFLRAHPVIVGVAVAAVMVFRARGLASLAGRGLAAWRIWRSLSAWAAGRVA